MKNVFCIVYKNPSSDYVPYKAIVHTPEEAIAAINTWTTYGRRNSVKDWERIKVNAQSEKKIREIFECGFYPEQVKYPSVLCGSLRTTGCGAWDICFYPAFADTLEEHERIYNERREIAKKERMRLAETAKQRRWTELKEYKRGWYHVSMEIRLYVFTDKGNDLRTSMEYSCNIIADSGIDAYSKTSKYLQDHPEELKHHRGWAVLESVCAPTSGDYDFTFLGMKTDEGYSVEAWEEWHKNGEKD